jgi:hypothetical protein
MRFTCSWNIRAVAIFFPFCNGIESRRRRGIQTTTSPEKRLNEKSTAVNMSIQLASAERRRRWKRTGREEGERRP